MENGTLNSRLLILESRIIALEKELKRLSNNMHMLDSNDELFLGMVKNITSLLECNGRIDEAIHETLLNRIKGINMHMGKVRKKINKMQEELNNFVHKKN